MKLEVKHVRRRSALLAAGAIMSVLPAMSDVPDVATGDFWYQEGRASYPEATAAATTTVPIATVPQVTGAPAFDSGAGDVAVCPFLTDFFSLAPGFMFIVF